MRRRRRKNPSISPWLAALAGSVVTGAGWMLWYKFYPPKPAALPAPGASASITLPTGIAT